MDDFDKQLLARYRKNYRMANLWVFGALFVLTPLTLLAIGLVTMMTGYVFFYLFVIPVLVVGSALANQRGAAGRLEMFQASL